MAEKILKRQRVVVILGPTAVGKTEASLVVAKKLHTEIISGDSMLVYKGLDIGTAKPDLAERATVKHHLIDILAPQDAFNVTAFCEKADILIDTLNTQHKIPIIVGGTGLYLKSLLEGYKFNTAPENPSLRLHLETLAKEHGREYVLAMLAKIDPDTAARLHVNNFRRIIRAIEVYEYDKATISRDKFAVNNELRYDAVVIGLNRQRSELYTRINERVDIMIKNGWLAEVETLLKSGVDRSSQSMQAIGYRQLAACLAGELPLSLAVDDIKKATRHFAKRQLTWYRKMPYINWLWVDKMTTEELADEICKLISQKFDYE
ncbi:tRNA (adenosine(37)-N6)-dimethylallyltransferase MiaA [Pectinatus cerevisiiphilus]|uniref:tRNA dimethylallyltransferase n=1 Tax=Pectinatus cerevisiiphilus TaxID=86956 RepID=A0A4R3KCZ1_9FIRM|nr:tRNA (adenosine(37)-N6)-dimethylallyltransferase MiaA [Pectinatus cerevisiiphilus]TCS80988.1 tRNA dimethylallyltransferase [Pectinatus cerevisiiphilus]